jgi:hypothetical protein
MEYLEEVITYQREALALCPLGHPQQALPCFCLPLTV